MSLEQWWPKTRSVEDDVRTILRADGVRDLSTAACRAWVRRFIPTILDDWEPGMPLTGDRARRVGAAFIKRLDAAQAQLPKPPRTEKFRRVMGDRYGPA